MGIVKVLFLVLLAYQHADCESSLSNTILLCHQKYIDNVLKMFVSELEEIGFCKIRMQDFTMPINESMYGLDVVGKLHYSDGFVVSINDISMKKSTTNHWISNNNLTATISTMLSMEGITYAYDVHGELIDHDQKATGLYFQKGTDWSIVVIKDLQTEEITVEVTYRSIYTESQERIRFMPLNDYTTVFARKFQPILSKVIESIRDWNATFTPILENITRNKIKFPEISFDRFVIDDNDAECE